MRKTGTWLMLFGASCALLVGCGGDSVDKQAGGSGTSLDSALILPADIEATPAGSPERAVLEYMQALQFSNVDGALDFYPKGEKPESKILKVQLAQIQGAIAGVPKLVQSTEDGDKAVLLMTAVRNERTAGFTVRMVKEGDEWLLADNKLVEQAALQARLQRERSG